MINIESQQGNSIPLGWKVFNLDGSTLTSAQVAGLTLKVFDIQAQTATTPTGGVALPASTVATPDANGNNLVIEVDGSYFPAVSTYQIEIVVQPLGNFNAFQLEYVNVATTASYS